MTVAARVQNPTRRKCSAHRRTETQNNEAKYQSPSQCPTLYLKDREPPKPASSHHHHHHRQVTALSFEIFARHHRASLSTKVLGSLV